jgi:hypothetical protein
MKTKLKKLTWSKCRNREVHVIAARIGDECGRHIPEDLYAIESAAKIRDIAIGMDAALTKKGRNPLTVVIKGKQRRRVNAFDSLVRSIDNLVADTDNPETAAKAQRLKTIIDQQGRSTCRVTYVKATSGIRVVLEELDKPENAAIIDELGLRNLVERLRTAQNDFEVTCNERVTIKSALPKMQNVRDAMEYALHDLLTHIEHAAEKEPQKYTTLVNEINEQITAIMTIVRARATRNKGEDSPPVAGKEVSSQAG